MEFGQAAVIIYALIAAAAAIPAAREQLRKAPQGFWKTLRYAAVYLVYIFFGFAILLWHLRYPRPDASGAAAVIFLVGWIFYGALWLTRLVPRYRDLPRWIDRRWSSLLCSFRCFRKVRLATSEN
jgi:hypothetical protein